MTKSPLERGLWAPRSVEDTKTIYADWADGYDADMDAMAYATPGRVAAAIVPLLPQHTAEILDFGCGTGLSGAALRAAGYTQIDGTDISAEMLEIARRKDIYRALWVGTPGAVAVDTGRYAAIVATGVVSLGAAPPEMLAILLRALAPGGLLGFSYNDPTLAAPDYLAALDAVQSGGLAQQVFRQHGPHLNDTVTGSDVIVLRRL